MAEKVQLPFQVGELNIDATGRIELTNSSIYNGIELGGIGNTANLNVNARSLYLTGGSQIATFNHGVGDAGDLSITIQDSGVIDGKNTRPHLRA